MSIFKKLLPHITAIIIFLLAAAIYFSPVFDGKQLPQSDVTQFIGMSKEISDYREQTGKEALWTNAAFGGMPAYQISVQFHHNIMQWINKCIALGLPSPIYYIFLAMVSFYIMLLCFGVNPWLSIAGAFAFGFSTYFLIIIGVGHNSKMRALMYMPLIIGGIYYAYNKQKLWVGVLITCIALGLQIRANHFQITYYTAIIVLIFVIFELVNIIKNGQYTRFVKISAGLLVALILAVSTNITNMLLTSEYTPDSTRGQSELTDSKGDQTKGLDKTYILDDYSYGITETMVLFIPNFVGGSTIGDAGEDSPYYNALIDHGVNKQQARQISKQAFLYWGGQTRGTSGPVYIGAVVIFLFVLGLFLVKGQVKWWLVIATVLSIMLAWGKYLPVFSNLFIDYFPMYNKFRTVSMTLVIAELTIPLLGILALKEFFSDEHTAIDKQRALKLSFFIAGGVALFFALLPGLFFSFSTPNDVNLAAQSGLPEWLIATLPDTREALMRSDSFRTFIFVALTAVLLWLVLKNKLKMIPACAVLALLILSDLWMVDKRYLNNNDFIAAREVKNPIKLTTADKEILQDESLDYRVLNLSVSTFNDGTTSYSHKSLGGYHGAKMKRYQELVEHQLGNEITAVITKLNTAKSMDDVADLFQGCTAMNMLNTRYLIYSPDHSPVSNHRSLGNAWMVPNIHWVGNADEEIESVSKFDPHRTVIVDKRYQSVINDFKPIYDSTALIRLTSYAPNHLVYEFKADQPQMVVFSEIFYDKGWNATIDGNPVPHVRANYVLRAMPVPAGEHKIEFRFEPQSYIKGERISLAGSIGVILLIIGVIGKEMYDSRKQKNNVQ